MGVFTNLLGIMGNLFQLGGPGGPALKNNSGNLEARNSADNAYVQFTASQVNCKATGWLTSRSLAGNSVDGTGDVPFANKFIVQGTTDTGLSGPQFLGALGTGIVKNTATTGILSIATSADIPIADGTIQTMSFAIGTSATYNSTAAITHNGKIYDIRVKITTPYDGGTTIAISTQGDTPTTIMATTENSPSVADEYNSDRTQSITSATTVTPNTVRATITGSPAAGVGEVTIIYCNVPLS